MVGDAHTPWRGGQKNNAHRQRSEWALKINTTIAGGMIISLLCIPKYFWIWHPHDAIMSAWFYVTAATWGLGMGVLFIPKSKRVNGAQKLRAVVLVVCAIATFAVAVPATLHVDRFRRGKVEMPGTDEYYPRRLMAAFVFTWYYVCCWVAAAFWDRGIMNNMIGRM
ncbi:capsular polysaccharide transport system permease protein [Microdochium nivale]|nr:capsular polysaccharide transport system permease protein [Microdochium nivale]